MTDDEIIDLLTMIAAYDQRTVGEADVVAWGAVSADQGWTYARAAKAVRVYYGSGGTKPRITPAIVSQTIDDAVKLIRLRLFRGDLTPPRELRDDPRAEIDWRRQRSREMTERALDAWSCDRPLSRLDAS